jgi:tellurite resistance protein
MTEALPDTPVGVENDDEAIEVVEQEREGLKDFVTQLSGDDIKSGNWFTKLCAHALNTYTQKANWQYFQEKYNGVPADAIVAQRIKMASRYAALEGGLSASAYTVAIAATIGTVGGASPATVPAAVGTIMLDVVFITQLQIRLAYDISVLYRVPLDVHDPDDLWKLIRVAFLIKGGELVREGVVKGLPPLTRAVLKKVFSGPVLAAAKGLPYVGKFLLQRNILKIGIPAVGVPISVLMNRYTTLAAGKHAQAVFRNEARVLEVAERISDRTRHPGLMLWVAWLVIRADGKTSDDETLLFAHLIRLAKENHHVVDERLARLIEHDPEEIWRRVEAESGDLTDISDMASRVAAVDGEINAREKALIAELADRCDRS